MSSVWHKIALFGGPVVLALLTAIAGYALSQQTQLALPIPLPLTILTFLLPLFTYFSTNLIHRLLFPGIAMTHIMAPGTISPRLGLGIPLIVLQSVYTTVIIVLSLSYTGLSSARHCLLEGQWATLFRLRDGAAIRAIQETFECCGFSGPHDRPYPFPIGRPTDPGYVANTECERQYGYRRSCEQPWTAAENSVATKLAVVGATVFVCQIIYYISVLYPNSTSSWADALKAITGSRSRNGSAAERRRNMRGLIQADVNGDSERVREVLDREEEEEESERGNEGIDRRLEEGRDGPRVETSALLDGWREHAGHGPGGSGNGAHL